MLYWLLYLELFPIFSPFRVFRYQTFRIAFASLTALMLAMVLGPWLIQRLREFQIGQYIREEGPESHKAKAGTPTMGGILILVSTIVPTLLWADPSNIYIWIVVFATAAFGFVGFLDDYLKIKRRQNLGLRARDKIFLQIVVSLMVGVSLLTLTAKGLYSTHLVVPFFTKFTPELLIESLMGNPYTYPL